MECTNGHGLQRGASFCSTCGAPAAAKRTYARGSAVISVALAGVLFAPIAYGASRAFPASQEGSQPVVATDSPTTGAVESGDLVPAPSDESVTPEASPTTTRVDDEAAIRKTLEGYLDAYAVAATKRNFRPLEQWIEPGSPLESMQRKQVDQSVSTSLKFREFDLKEWSLDADSDYATVRITETYWIRSDSAATADNKSGERVSTFESGYLLHRDGSNSWLMYELLSYKLLNTEPLGEASPSAAEPVTTATSATGSVTDPELSAHDELNRNLESAKGLEGSWVAVLQTEALDVPDGQTYDGILGKYRELTSSYGNVMLINPRPYFKFSKSGEWYMTVINQRFSTKQDVLSFCEEELHLTDTDSCEPMEFEPSTGYATAVLNVRRGPGIDNDEVGKLPLGGLVNIAARAMGPGTEDEVLWYQIEDGGWVAAEHVRLIFGE